MAPRRPELEDTSSPESFAESDKEAIARFNKILEERLQREAKAHQRYDWKGNKLPPFSIEPLPHERNRLSTPMTPENRALRKQWVLDQRLGANEPVYVPEMHPKNFFRRTWSYPWDRLYFFLKSRTNVRFASHVRYWGPKAIGGPIIAMMMWYHLKYHPFKWEVRQGWQVYRSKPYFFPEDEGYPAPETKPQDFFDHGFQIRKSHTTDS